MDEEESIFQLLCKQLKNNGDQHATVIVAGSNFGWMVWCGWVGILLLAQYSQ